MLRKHMNGDDFQTQCHHSTQLYIKLRHFHVVKAGISIKVRKLPKHSLIYLFIKHVFFIYLGERKEDTLIHICRVISVLA
jgi:hypothetical protein